MTTRRFAGIFGAVFLIIGVLGFVPGINHMHYGDPNLAIEGPGHGHLLGLFHVNVVHNLIHVAFGVGGLLAARRAAAAKGYFQFVAVSYLGLALLGLVSAGNVNNLFGVVPIHGNDVWLHAIIGLSAAVLGFLRTSAHDRGGRYAGRPSTA
jgi:hypothetical protein